MTSMLRNQSPAANENDIRMRSNRPGKDNKESKESKDNQAAQQQQQQQSQQNQQPEGGSSQPSSPAHTRDRGLAKKCCFCWCCAPPCFSKYVLSDPSFSHLSTSKAFVTALLHEFFFSFHSVRLYVILIQLLSIFWHLLLTNSKVRGLKVEVHDLEKHTGAFNNFFYTLFPPTHIF